jgi:hypothetical protein
VRYRVRAYSGNGELREGITGEGIASPITVTGFPAPPAMGNYTFTVSAVYSDGTESKESAASQVVHIMYGHM